MKRCIKTLGCPIKAKQAWTDVAQLSALGICAFNFGPGRQDQAHQPNEYVQLSDMVQYEELLMKMEMSSGNLTKKLSKIFSIQDLYTHCV